VIVFGCTERDEVGGLWFGGGNLLRVGCTERGEVGGLWFGEGIYCELVGTQSDGSEV
jgi:hypothetical protein